nr:MAG TPA: hypothetical protein [Caudoviricetes sp.]DAV34040.1 MAG TPA: hypothetical protein [Caudoviricetes sp.]
MWQHRRQLPPNFAFILTTLVGSVSRPKPVRNL